LLCNVICVKRSESVREAELPIIINYEATNTVRLKFVNIGMCDTAYA